MATTRKKRALTAGSLFSGVGMFDYAFAVAGFDILFQVEIDTYCQKVLKKHAPTYWPNAEIHADVCGVGKHNLPYVDALFGGFPCTDISVAGRGEGIQVGTRSGLWFEFKRIIGEIRPRVVLLENVAAITRKDGIIVISDLAEMGYDAKWGVISAADAGAPHLRERWWCVAISNTAHEGVNRRHGQQRDYAARCGAGSVDCRIRSHDRDAMANPSGIRFCDSKNGSGDDSNIDWDSTEKNEGREKKSFGVTGANGQMEHAHLERREELRPAASHWQARHTGGRSGAAGIGGGHENKSRLGRVADGSTARMDGSGLMAHVFPVGPNMPQPDSEAPRMAVGTKTTNARLKALGNGGMPQIVYPIALELRKLLEGDGS